MPGALTHARITLALSSMAPQVPSVTPGSPLCPWCFGHSSWRGAQQQNMENATQRGQQYMVHDMKAIIKPTCWSKMTYRLHRVIIGVPSHTHPHLDVVLEVHNNMISAFIPINLYGRMALIDMRMNNCIVQCIGFHYPSTPSLSLTHTIK